MTHSCPTRRSSDLHVNEGLADELALGLGIGEPLKLVQEQPFRLHMDQRDAVLLAEQADDLFCLAKPHQPVVDERTGPLVADRLMAATGAEPPMHSARTAADDAWRAVLDRESGESGKKEQT